VRRLALGVAAVLALAVPAAALAGGWATVRLASTPKGVTAGTPWNARVTVLQHGVTPLEHVRPVVRIRKGTTRLAFPARPTRTSGVYAARVVFPSAGVWRYAVWDGFVEYGGARTHTFAPVRIAPQTAAR
jgi:hypothetical protein